MRSLLVLLAVTVFGAPAFGAPGDPRIVQGMVEWPQALGTEAFIVVRGDDGGTYAVDVQNAQRRGSGPVGAGNRISVVGVEASRPYEVAALAIGVGDAAIATFPMPSMPPHRPPRYPRHRRPIRCGGCRAASSPCPARAPWCGGRTEPRTRSTCRSSAR